MGHFSMEKPPNPGSVLGGNQHDHGRTGEGPRRVVFAGSLGRAMWTVGKALLAAAAGAAGDYYTMTGRPPR